MIGCSIYIQAKAIAAKIKPKAALMPAAELKQEYMAESPVVAFPSQVDGKIGKSKQSPEQSEDEQMYPVKTPSIQAILNPANC